MSRLQELDPLISGGTTAVVAVIVGDTLYTANTGDSRAVLVAGPVEHSSHDGLFDIKQVL